MAENRDTIRVGIIRCDTHGFWYAPLFEAPDPDRYRKAHRGCHYYFFEPDDPRKLRFRPVSGMAIAKVFDPDDRGRAEALSDAYGGRPQVCDSFDEVSDDVDLVYLADCNGNGEDHLQLATPGLTKGVPHFVDKPFANTLADARAIIHLAQRHDAPVMCASLLRYSPFLDRFRTRLKDIAPVDTLLVPTYAPQLACLFHALSTVQCVLGAGCEWTESMGPQPGDLVRLGFTSATAIICTTAADTSAGVTGASNYHHCANCISAYGAGGAIHSPPVDDYRFPYGGVRIVKMARDMARTKEPPIQYDSMLELMEIIEAARLSHRESRRVTLEEIRAAAASEART